MSFFFDTSDRGVTALSITLLCQSEQSLKLALVGRYLFCTTGLSQSQKFVRLMSCLLSSVVFPGLLSKRRVRWDYDPCAFLKYAGGYLGQKHQKWDLFHEFVFIAIVSYQIIS